MKKFLPLCALTFLALTGCSSNNSDTRDSGTPSASSSSTATSPKPSSTVTLTPTPQTNDGMNGVSDEIKQWQKDNKAPFRAEVAEDGKVSWYDASGNAVYGQLAWLDTYPFTADEKKRVEEGLDKALDDMQKKNTSSTPSASTATSSTNGAAENTKTSFSGTTLKGNDLNFIILPRSAQQEMNDSAIGSGATGSWGALCSNAATPEQLSETGVTTTEPNGGHSHIWRSLKYAADEANNRAAIDGVALANIMNSSSEVQSLGKQCVVMNSYLPSAGAQEYPSATAGRYISGDLIDTVELY